MQKIGIIILLLSKSLLGDYFISFDFTSHNSKLVSFHFNCSKTMTNNFSKKIFLFKFKTSYKSVEKICKFQRDKIINNLLHNNFYIYSINSSLNNMFFSKQKGIYLPKRFDIIIEDGYVKFYLKEED